MLTQIFAAGAGNTRWPGSPGTPQLPERPPETGPSGKSKDISYCQRLLREPASAPDSWKPHKFCRQTSLPGQSQRQLRFQPLCLSFCPGDIVKITTSTETSGSIPGRQTATLFPQAVCFPGRRDLEKVGTTRHSPPEPPQIGSPYTEALVCPENVQPSKIRALLLGSSALRKHLQDCKSSPAQRGRKSEQFRRGRSRSSGHRVIS